MHHNLSRLFDSQKKLVPTLKQTRSQVFGEDFREGDYPNQDPSAAVLLVFKLIYCLYLTVNTGVSIAVKDGSKC